MIEVIKEYLVSVGFEVDKKSIGKADKALKDFDKKVEKIDKTFQTVENALGKIFGRRGKIGKDAKETGEAVEDAAEDVVASVLPKMLGMTAAITAAVVALGVAITAAFAKWLDGVAQADMKTQLFARRLMTTVNNARSLENVMKAMGLSDLNQLNDVAMNPELRKQFVELRQLSSQMKLDAGAEQGFKNIRAIGYEMQKLGLIVDYFFQRLAGQFGNVLGPLLKTIQGALAGITKGLSTSAPIWSRVFSKMLGNLVKLLEIILRLSGVPLFDSDVWEKMAGGLDKVALVAELIEDIYSKIADSVLFILRNLPTTGNIINELNRAITGVTSGKNPMDRLFELIQKIAGILDQFWKWIQSLKNSPIGKFLTWSGEASKNVGGAIGKLNPVGMGEAVGKAIVQHFKTTSGGKASFNPGVRLSEHIKTALDDLNKVFGDKYTVTSGVSGRSGKSWHPKGLAMDLVPRDQSIGGYAKLTASALQSPSIKALNLELKHNRYLQVIQQLKGMGVDTSRVHNQITKDFTGEHLHATLNPRRTQAPITINVHDAHDPHKTAQVVREVLNQRDQRTIRNHMGAFA